MTTPLRSAPLSYTQLLRGNRVYRNLWLSQVVSNAGDWFSTIAVLLSAAAWSFLVRSVPLGTRTGSGTGG